MTFGNWYRPISELANQVALGVSFVIGHEPGGSAQPVTREQYKAACRALGLKYILQAPPDDATLALEAQDPFCLGWNQPDEPNAGQPSTIPVTTLQANYAKYKKAAPSKIVLINFDGSQNPTWNPGFDYLAATACGDWVMVDYYVRNRDGAKEDIKATMRPILDRFRSYCKNGQKLGFFVETDDQHLSKTPYFPNGCGPGLHDVQDYFDLAKESNCEVLSFFEDVIGKWWESYSATSADMYALIKRNIAALNPPPQRTAKSVTWDGTGMNVLYSDNSSSKL